MERIQFLLDWYNKEEERKASVENSLNIPIGILTLLFIVQFYLTTEFDFNYAASWEFWILILCIVLSFVLSLIAGFYIFKSYHNFPRPYKYLGIPYPSQLLKYERDLISFYKEHSSHFPGVNGEEKFQEYLCNKLAEQLDVNTNNNDDKYRFLNLSKTMISISIITLVISSVPFLTNFFSKPSKPLEMKIIDIDSYNRQIDSLKYEITQIKMSINNSNPQQPTPPPPPPDRQIREFRPTTPPPPPPDKK